MIATTLLTKDELIEAKLDTRLRIPREWTDVLLPGLTDVLAAVDLTSTTPSADKIFDAFCECPRSAMSVVIIGQDPYHNGTADGLCFSSIGRPIQKSLVNILKCLQRCGYSATGSNLRSWAHQGVLLLNTALTTQFETPKAHSKIWSKYITRLMTDLHPRVYMAFGNDAIKLAAAVTKTGLAPMSTDASSGCFVFTWSHPSPLNRANTKTNNPSHFINCDAFVKTNVVLKAAGLPEINWATPDVPSRLVEPAVSQDDRSVTTDNTENSYNIDSDMVFLLSIKISTFGTVVIATKEPCPVASIDVVLGNKTWIFTDGAATANGSPDCRASYGVVIFSNDDALLCSEPSSLQSCRPSTFTIAGHVSPCTNNRGEMLGLLLALMIAADTNYENVVIVSDSKYAINTAAEYYKKWVDTDTLQGKANLDMAKELHETCVAVRGRVSTLEEWRRGVCSNTINGSTIIHTRGHRVEPTTNALEWLVWYGNTCADKAATSILERHL